MGIRILVVEDEAEIADFLVRGLREEGFTVEHVADGESAVHSMKVADWDLVLLDWSLPGLDGLTVLRRHREAGGDAPVLFLTARDAVGDRVRGLDWGADDYLGKPFAFEELLARVRALVRRPRGGGVATLSFADVRVDLVTHRADRAGKVLDLTAKEQALLVFFLRHPGEVLSRTRIYEHVWDERYDGTSNTLEVHVMELRRKLEAKGPRLIQTVRGRGYLLGEPEGGRGLTLTDRLSATFLGALAMALVGFSTALYLVASVHLHRSVDDRLDAALGTLAAMVEDEPGGLDWEREGRPVSIGQDPGHDQVRWIVLDGRGEEVDRSRNLAEPGAIREAGPRRLDRRGHPWRVAARRLRSAHAASPAESIPPRSAELTLSAGLKLDPAERTLRNLAVALASISAALWGVTAMVGRRLCRRALAPLTRMASDARELGADEPGRRLAVASTGDELEELATAFNGLLGRWQEALERQARFAGDASHQLRTPLTALIGQVDVALRRDRPPEEYRATLARARDQADRLRRIVEALLFLARADSEAGLPALEEFDLVAWTSDQVRRRAIERGPDGLLWDEPPGGPFPVRAHPALLAQVLDNLLDNARDHGGSGGPARVRLDREPGLVALSVEDRGRGIGPADLARVFEPFYRAADARGSAAGGVGLGLAVARRIARAMGGSLDAESRPGQGARFTIRLPA